MEHGHDDFEGRALLLLVHIDWDTTTVIDNLDRIVWKDEHLYIVTVASQSLIDTVIYNLADQVVQTLDAGITDIHGRALADGLKAFEHLDMTRVVIILNF